MLYNCYCYLIAEHFYYPQRNLAATVKQSLGHFSLSLSPGTKPLIYFLSLWIFLFWTFHKWNHTVCSLCVWFPSLGIMLSRFIYIMACTNTSFLFMTNNIPLYGYIILFEWTYHSWVNGLMDIWVVFSFQLFVNKATVNFHMQIFVGTYISVCELLKFEFVVII